MLFCFFLVKGHSDFVRSILSLSKRWRKLNVQKLSDLSRFTQLEEEIWDLNPFGLISKLKPFPNTEKTSD